MNRSLKDRLVSALHAAWERGETDEFEALVNPSYQRSSGDQDRFDLEQWRFVITSTRASFSDLRLTIEDVIAEDDKVAVRWSSVATHRGSYMDVPATGRVVAVEGATFFVFRDGLLVEERGTWMPTQLLGALGIVFLRGA